jgi:hypothetical protein
VGIVILTENGLWDRVRGLQDSTIYTPDQRRPNRVINVTDNSVIFDRPSTLAREDFFEMYRLIICRGILTRSNTPAHFFNSRIARICYALLAEAAHEQIRSFSRRESPPAAQGLSGIEYLGKDPKRQKKI